MRRLTLLVLLAGCGPGYRVDDSFSSSLDLSIFGDRGANRISSPYLREAAFEMRIVGDPRRIVGLSLASDDHDVLSVGPTQPDPENDERRIAEVVAVGPGETTVRVVDDRGRQRMAFGVRVADPDRATLHPVARLVRDDLSADDLPTVVVGGRAEVEVHPFDGADLLAGSVWRAPASPADLLVESSRYRSSGLHDVLALTASAVGAWTLTIPYVGGDVDVEVDAVAPEAVTGLDVACMSDEDLVAGDTLYCQCTARLADASEVYGVAPTWNVGGDAVEGSGDLVIVAWDGGDLRDATALFGSLSASASVRGAGQEVTSTNDVVACASVGGASPWAAWLSLGLVMLRRGRSEAHAAPGRGSAGAQK